MKRSNKFSGVLGQLYPGTAKAWHAWLGDYLEGSTGFMKLRGGNVPYFMEKYAKKLGLKSLDDVGEALRTAGVQYPRTDPYPKGTDLPVVYYVSRVYDLDDMEKVLAWTHQMKTVTRTVTEERYVGRPRTVASTKIVVVRKDFVVPLDTPEEEEDRMGAMIRKIKELRVYCSLAQDERVEPFLGHKDASAYLNSLEDGSFQMSELDEDILEKEKELKVLQDLRAVIGTVKYDPSDEALVECLMGVAPKIKALGVKAVLGTKFFRERGSEEFIEHLVDTVLGASELVQD